MGFTEYQAEQLYDSVSRMKGGNAAKHVLSTLSVLFVLGLNPTTVHKLLDKCPELYTVKDVQLQQRITQLRHLGFVEGEIIFQSKVLLQSTVQYFAKVFMNFPHFVTFIW